MEWHRRCKQDDTNQIVCDNLNNWLRTKIFKHFKIFSAFSNHLALLWDLPFSYRRYVQCFFILKQVIQEIDYAPSAEYSFCLALGSYFQRTHPKYITFCLIKKKPIQDIGSFDFQVRWRTVICGFVMQVCLGFLCIRLEIGREIFRCIGHRAIAFLHYSRFGSAFVYGELLVRTEAVLAFAVRWAGAEPKCGSIHLFI